MITNTQKQILDSRRVQIESFSNRIDALVHDYERDNIFSVAAKLRAAVAKLREALEFCEK